MVQYVLQMLKLFQTEAAAVLTKCAVITKCRNRNSKTECVGYRKIRR